MVRCKKDLNGIFNYTVKMQNCQYIVKKNIDKKCYL